jgi:hypothetical protein
VSVVVRLRTFVAAGFTTGYIVGTVCGIALTAVNPLGSFQHRLLMVFGAGALYSILLALPIAVVLVAGESLGRALGRGSGTGSPRFIVVLRNGLLIAGAGLVVRHIAELYTSIVTPYSVPEIREIALSATGFGLGVLGVTWLLTVVGRRVDDRIGGRRLAVAGMLVLLSISVIAALLPVGSFYRPATQTVKKTPESVAATNQIEAKGPERSIALIGFDGLDPVALDVLIQAGELPHLAALRDRSLWSPLETLPGGLSPPIWTTIATGVDPTRHGIHDFLSRRIRFTGIDLAAVKLYPRGFGAATLSSALGRTPLVREVLVTPLDRRAPAIWTIASLAGVETCVIDWMVTWPSERLQGVMVSDRSFFAANLGTVALQVEGLERTEAPLRLVTKDLPQTDLSESPGLCFPEPGCGQYLPAHRGSRIDPSDSMRFHIAEDRFYLEVAERLLPGRDCQLFVFYSHLPDFINHQIGVDALDQVLGGDLASPGAQRFLEVYRTVDRTFGRLTSALGSGTAVLVVSDHGVSVETRKGVSEVSHGFPAPPGVFLFAPSQNRGSGRLATRPTVYDVAPTILALLGLPVTDEMSGSVIDSVLEAELGEERTVRVIAAERIDRMVEEGEITAKDTREVEDDMLERLKSLGYIE